MNKDRRNEIAAAFPLIAEAAAKLQEARDAVESAKNEEEEYLEGMPEGFKNGDKGETAAAAIAALDEALEAFDTVDLSRMIGPLEEACEQSANLQLPEPTLSAEEAEERRYSRLPEWVRAQMDRLLTTVETTRSEMSSMFADPVEGSTHPIVDSYDRPLHGKELPCSRVRFPQVGVTVYMDHGMLCIHGLEPFVLKSHASNMIYVQPERIR